MSNILYSQNNCAPCVMLKKYLDHKGVEYEIRNRDEYAEEMVHIGGMITTPLFKTEKGHVYGYAPQKLIEIL